ncbi:MAG: dihydrodipicolinate synthase family protein, partial [Tepidisphaeraceae bacterium]
HWSVWTQGAVKMQADLRRRALAGDQLSPDVLTLAAEVTDCNAAFFDAANGFKGCIAGLHAVLHRQGLLNNILCLDESEDLSPGQMQEIERVHRAYPHLNDDAFVSENRDAWLSN